MIVRLFLIAFIIINMDCTGQIQEQDYLKIKYFQSWGGYKIPKRPQLEIDSDNLGQYSSYFKAYYNGDLIVKFEQYVDQNLIGYDEYEYWDKRSKLNTHTSVNSLGEKKIHLYNKKGKLITK